MSSQIGFGGFGEVEEQEEEEDQFERLPDALLLAIFNSLQEVKSLGRCCAVSRRFRSLALQTESVVVRVDCIVSGHSSYSTATTSTSTAADSDAPKYGGVLGTFGRLLFSTFVSRPLHALHQILLPKKVLLAAEISHHSPSEVLLGFQEIRSLRVVLPSSELGLDPGAVLRWNAEFGRSLDSCTILGATSFLQRDPPVSPVEIDESSGADDQSFCTNGGLKLRVVWTITSLIAASARHFLLRNIVADHPTLQSLEITDTNGQGVLRMGKGQLKEFRGFPLEAVSSSNRTQVPALNMKLWYAPRLVLKSGYELDGATLVAIRPVDRPIKMEGDGFVVGAFDGPFREVAKAMVKRKTYLLEMNPF